MKTTLQQLSKIPNVTGLYRHENGTYYAKKKIKGKKVVRCLGVSDRKLAEAKLSELEKTLEGCEGGAITLEGLCQKFLDAKKGNRQGTIDVYQWVINRLRDEFPLFRSPVLKITPLDYQTFIAGMKLQPRGTNIFFEILSGILEVGVSGKYLLMNPIAPLKKRIRRKVVKKVPLIPTNEQAEKIIAELVSKGKESGPLSARDYLRFLYYAGIGEAELNNIRWKDIDFEKERISVLRVKTNTPFEIPFYPWLKPFLIELRDKREKKYGPIFKIKSIKQGIWNACKRLKLPKFSPKSFRKACIVRQLRGGLPVKLVSKYQGHQDGGVLILRVYSQVISETESDYEKEQLAKLGQ